MTTAQAVKTLSAVIRRKHLALNTEQIYCGWLKRYCNYLQTLPPHLRSELKLERFLMALAQNHVTASTQNQAFNAILFFYKEAMGIITRSV
jgi:site-specific recombinase XerD